MASYKGAGSGFNTGKCIATDQMSQSAASAPVPSGASVRKVLNLVGADAKLQAGLASALSSTVEQPIIDTMTVVGDVVAVILKKCFVQALQRVFIHRTASRANATLDEVHGAMAHEGARSSAIVMGLAVNQTSKCGWLRHGGLGRYPPGFRQGRNIRASQAS